MKAQGNLAGLGAPSTCNRSVRRIAVWGSAGSGKTLVAMNVAFELARLGHKVMLVDLDMKRPSIASWLGLTDAGPGLTATLRLAGANRLDIDEVMRICAELKFGGSSLEVLTGLSSPKRWTEVSFESLSSLIASLDGHFDYVVMDLNDDIEEAPMAAGVITTRQRVTKWIIDEADLVLATFIADAVGINRFLFDLREIDGSFWLVANRVNSKVFGGTANGQLESTMRQFTSMRIRAHLPADFASCAATISRARPLMLESPNARLTLTIRRLTSEIVDELGTGINSRSGET